ncbi:hypothetical protein SDD30_14285 [Moorella naiadis]|uniref:hypothetical protein n=1 Tax=Moorella naiadis (nom. illeg.) TaxID=3093670 RepID=UPI003D9C9B4A
MKKAVVFIALLPAVILLVLAVMRIAEAGPPQRAADTYIHALASGDVDGGKAVSSGKAAEAAGKLEGQNLAARVDEVSTSVQALGRGWARVEATVELTLQDGTADVGWYDLDVVKEAGGWKVASFREYAPNPSGWSLLWGRSKDVAAAKEVFAGYLYALAAGKWDDAVKYLAGPARKSMEASRDVLSKGKIIGKVDDLQAKLVWARGKEMMIRFNYKIDGRETGVMAVFYETKYGWRICHIFNFGRF